MALTSGFFNSRNGDRRYTLEQFSMLFGMLVKDGVYPDNDKLFKVTIGTDGRLLIGEGRAWIDDCWVHNDSTAFLDYASANGTPPVGTQYRIDAVVITIDKRDESRSTRFEVINGDSNVAANLTYPDLEDEDSRITHHAIAYIFRKPGTDADDDSIVSAVGLGLEADPDGATPTLPEGFTASLTGSPAGIPLMTGILETANISSIIRKWDNQMADRYDNIQANSQMEISYATHTFTINDWQQSDEYVYQTATMSALSGGVGKNVIADVDFSDATVTDVKEIIDAWSEVFKMEYDDETGDITLYMWTAPTVDIPVKFSISKITA